LFVQQIKYLPNKVSAKGTTTSVVNDSSSFCIQKTASQTKTTNLSDIKTTPATGPEALPLFGLLGSGIVGVYLRKKN
jgi:hypothetical protein